MEMMGHQYLTLGIPILKLPLNLCTKFPSMNYKDLLKVSEQNHNIMDLGFLARWVCQKCVEWLAGDRDWRQAFLAVECVCIYVCVGGIISM